MIRPTFTELLDWLEGRLDEAQGADVADRVAHGDRATTDAADWIRSFLDTAGQMPLATPPAEVSAAIRTAIDEHLAPWSPGDYSEAALAYDSRSMRVGGTRAADPTGTTEDLFHLVFETEAGQLVLDVIPVPEERVDLQGSVPETLVGGDDPTRVVLTDERVVVRTATCGPGGQFRVSDVPVGVDEIWVTHGGALIRAAVQLHTET